MEHISSFEKRIGCDVGYNKDNLDIPGCIHRVGVSGFDKNLSLNDMINLAYSMKDKPNIIVKAGLNAKWYLKSFPKNEIDNEIEKQRWRNISRCTIWILEWDN